MTSTPSALPPTFLGNLGRCLQKVYGSLTARDVQRNKQYVQPLRTDAGNITLGNNGKSRRRGGGGILRGGGRGKTFSLFAPTPVSAERKELHSMEVKQRIGDLASSQVVMDGLNETCLKMAALTYLHMQPDLQVWSEVACHKGQPDRMGYIDLLVHNATRRETTIIELKYIPASLVERKSQRFRIPWSQECNTLVTAEQFMQAVHDKQTSKYAYDLVELTAHRPRKTTSYATQNMYVFDGGEMTSAKSTKGAVGVENEHTLMELSETHLRPRVGDIIYLVTLLVISGGQSDARVTMHITTSQPHSDHPQKA